MVVYPHAVWGSLQGRRYSSWLGRIPNTMPHHWVFLGSYQLYKVRPYFILPSESHWRQTLSSKRGWSWKVCGEVSTPRPNYVTSVNM